MRQEGLPAFGGAPGRCGSASVAQCPRDSGTWKKVRNSSVHPRVVGGGGVGGRGLFWGGGRMVFGEDDSEGGWFCGSFCLFFIFEDGRRSRPSVVLMVRQEGLYAFGGAPGHCGSAVLWLRQGRTAFSFKRFRATKEAPQLLCEPRARFVSGEELMVLENQKAASFQVTLCQEKMLTLKIWKSQNSR